MKNSFFVNLFIALHVIFFCFLSGSVHPMVTVTPSPLGGQLQASSVRSADSSPSHSHSHSHSQMSRNSSRKSNNSVNCKLDGECLDYIYCFSHSKTVHNFFPFLLTFLFMYTFSSFSFFFISSFISLLPF